MRRLIVSTYMTLDGRVDDVREWAPAYDEGWAAAYHDELLAHCDGLLLGRKTYELFAAIWPARANGVPYADKLNQMAKHVASTTLRELTWHNSHLIEGDAVAGVAKLKRQPGQDLVMYGCRTLMHSLLPHDLIDEVRVLVSPVLLGKGKSFLDDGTPRVNLALVATATSPTGVVTLTYRPAR